MQVSLIQITNPQFWGILVLDGKIQNKARFKKIYFTKVKNKYYLQAF